MKYALDVSATDKPPAGAIPVRTAVPVTFAPPTTEAGVNVKL